MTPNEVLCLDCIRYWIHVVEKNNGSCGEIVDGVAWTRISAAEMSAWIKQQHDCDMTIRQCSNALRSLVETERVIREQRWTDHWNRAYSYRLADVPSASIERAPQGQSNPPPEDTSMVPPMVDLSSTSTNPSSSVSTEERTADEGRSRATRPTAPSPQAKYRSTGMASNLETPLGAYTISRIEQVCRAIGDGDLPLPQNEPDRYQELRRETSP